MGLIKAVDIPERSLNGVTVSKFTVANHDSFMSFLTGKGRGVPEGEYTKLVIDGRLVMSDTPDEMRDHYGFVRRAVGDILINGLGLGMAVGAVLAKPGVQHVTVIEKDQRVIELIAEHYRSSRCEIIHADAFDYMPQRGTRYNAVWHDIWPDLCADNLSEMTRLKRKYGRRCDWQGCWGEEILRYRERQEKRQRSAWRRR